jgi:hypothetical protein
VRPNSVRQSNGSVKCDSFETPFPGLVRTASLEGEPWSLDTPLLRQWRYISSLDSLSVWTQLKGAGDRPILEG